MHIINYVGDTRVGFYWRVECALISVTAAAAAAIKMSLQARQDSSTTMRSAVRIGAYATATGGRGWGHSPHGRLVECMDAPGCVINRNSGVLRQNARVQLVFCSVERVASLCVRKMTSTEHYIHSRRSNYK